MSSIKVDHLYRDCAAGVCVSGPRTHTPPPPPITHCICVYGTHGRGGGELNQREGEMGYISQSYKILTWLNVSINSNEHLTQSPFTGQHFYMTFIFSLVSHI